MQQVFIKEMESVVKAPVRQIIPVFMEEAQQNQADPVLVLAEHDLVVLHNDTNKRGLVSQLLFQSAKIGQEDGAADLDFILEIIEI